MNYLITGANGFIGKRLCAELLRQGHSVRAEVRSANSQTGIAEEVVVGSIDAETDWAEALRGVDIVIHLAARVHVMNETAADPLGEFLKINMQGTANLAYQAAAAGVKRLVYVSSIKVNGEVTLSPSPSPRGGGGQNFFTEADAPLPQDPYGVSKWQAEQALQRIARDTGLEVVIVRPPLVYGPDVKGNFIRLLATIDQGIPLPLANVYNKRSMIYLDNLVDALIACASHSAAAGKTYLVRDGEDISTPDLVRQIAIGLERPARLFPIPVWLLRGLGRIFGKPESVERLVGSLCINDELIRKELGWKPRFTLQQGLRATTAWYKKQHNRSGITHLKKRSTNTHTECNASVVIVNYNAGKKLLECVAQALQQVEQVIVVDNASSDSSITELRSTYPATQIICNEQNLGFATACNLGAQIADDDHILFLNPDCILEPGAISALVRAVESAPDVGMAGGLLTNPDGTEQVGARRAVPTPWRSFVRAFGFSSLCNRYPRLFDDFALHKRPLPDHPVEVEAISGACMMVRRGVMEEIGLLDEGYFMHCEDLDWCMRIRQSGRKILFVPDARIVHDKGHCSKVRPIFVEWHKHKGMMRFYLKFFRHQYPGLLMCAVATGVWMRFTAITFCYLIERLLRKFGLRCG